jgi:ferric-dicitrate binding protein FerR (iron transport regulator)
VLLEDKSITLEFGELAALLAGDEQGEVSRADYRERCAIEEAEREARRIRLEAWQARRAPEASPVPQTTPAPEARRDLQRRDEAFNRALYALLALMVAMFAVLAWLAP